MLQRNLYQFLTSPRRSFHLVPIRLSKSDDSLQTFVHLPQFGNSNTNPLKHRQMVSDRSPKKNGKKLSVAILGVPNSGKSTLINRLMEKEVCPASCKHNTTRSNARAVVTRADTQVVFLDTPGVVDEHEARRFKLEDSLIKDPEKSCREADLLIVLQDVSNRFVREAIDKKILRLLCKYQHRVPSILVLNKLDSIPRSRRIYDLIRKLTCNQLEEGSSQIKISQHDPKWNVESYVKRKKRLMELTDTKMKKEDRLTVQDVLEECRRGKVSEERIDFLVMGLIGWPGFRDVFSISAKHGDGVEDLKEYLFKAAKPGGHRFSSDLLVDVDPRESVVNIVKSKMLEHLDHDVPYALNPELENWEYDETNKILRLGVSIQTKTHRQSSYLIGENGRTIRLIAEEAEEVLEDFFDHKVKLNIQPLLPENLQKSKTIEPKNLEKNKNIPLVYS